MIYIVPDILIGACDDSDPPFSWQRCRYTKIPWSPETTNTGKRLMFLLFLQFCWTSSLYSSVSSKPIMRFRFYTVPKGTKGWSAATIFQNGRTLQRPVPFAVLLIWSACSFHVSKNYFSPTADFGCSHLPENQNCLIPNRWFLNTIWGAPQRLTYGKSIRKLILETKTWQVCLLINAVSGLVLRRPLEFWQQLILISAKGSHIDTYS